MKSKIPGFLAVVLALSLSAFTSLHKPRQSGYYWFPLNSFSGAPQPVSALTYLTYDPYYCTNWAPGGYCSGAFTSYSGTPGAYTAAGTEMLVHFSMFH